MLLRPIEYGPVSDIYAASVHVEDAGHGMVRCVLAVPVDGELRATAAVVMTTEAARMAAASVLAAINHELDSGAEVSE